MDPLLPAIYGHKDVTLQIAAEHILGYWDMEMLNEMYPPREFPNSDYFRNLNRLLPFMAKYDNLLKQADLTDEGKKWYASFREFISFIKLHDFEDFLKHVQKHSGQQQETLEFMIAQYRDKIALESADRLTTLLDDGRNIAASYVKPRIDKFYVRTKQGNFTEVMPLWLSDVLQENTNGQNYS